MREGTDGQLLAGAGKAEPPRHHGWSAELGKAGKTVKLVALFTAVIVSPLGKLSVKPTRAAPTSAAVVVVPMHNFKRARCSGRVV